MIAFGSMSITLMIGALYGVLFAALLWLTKHNRLANRLLALLLVVIAMRLFPYIIGYAGFYDAYPWLSFLPYNASLAIGPLLYFYVRSLSSAEEGFRAAWLAHFLPVAIQLGYSLIIFPQPLAFKNEWNTNVHVPYVLPFEQLFTLLSIAVYWALSISQYRRYQHWLEQNVSDREDHHVVWVRNFLIALGLTLVFWVALIAIQRFIAQLNYFQVFPFYLWLQILAYYLGTEGYRNANHAYPRMSELGVADKTSASEPARTEEPAPQTSSEPAATPERVDLIDWSARAARLREAMVAHQYWQDPTLTLASLARKMGTNTSDLSRTINEGEKMNFNELVNRYRVAFVQEKMGERSKSSLLDLAFEAGFSSKASFNRSFKLYTGSTPSEFRENLQAERLKS